MKARYEIRDAVAVVTLDNPPVNALGFAVRRAVADAIERAERDPGVLAIVIAGAGRCFCTGADIREFNTPDGQRAPALPSLLDIVEKSVKPVVVAMHGMALGGGLELALAAHYRMAARDTQLGLPEVKLGLLPGAGGTQRLPRAVGLENALNMIVSGAPVKAEELSGTRLLDRVIESDLIANAVVFAREVGARSAPHPRLRDLEVEHPNAEGFLGFARAAVAAASGPYPAPLKCLEAVEAAVKMPFEAGLRLEREAFQALVETPESQSLRHAFFAERAAAKVPGVSSAIKLRRISEVAVIGAGTMGSGIAMNFLNAGIPVTLIEANSEALARGVAAIRANYEARARKGKLSPEDVMRRLYFLRASLEYGAARQADLIIEAVFEDIAVKESVFRKLETIAKPEAILATNTSTLDVNRIAAFTQRPENVLGMHFFSPANVMKLLEVIRGEKTALEVLATVMSVAGKIGKVAVVSGVCDGFIGNRMLEQYLRQAGNLLEEGALPQQIDGALERFGFAMGPFRMSDLAGNDIGWAIRKRRYLEKPDLRYSPLFDRLCEQGRFGQKTSAGWYDYRAGERAAIPSQAVEQMIVDHSRALGLSRRRIADEEIIERLVYALVNEGAKILEEGVAARASDIDVVYLNGYGFPRWRGGPMFHADSVGLYEVRRAMRGFAAGYQGQDWEPAPLLAELAEKGGSFND